MAARLLLCVLLLPATDTGIAQIMAKSPAAPCRLSSRPLDGAQQRETFRLSSFLLPVSRRRRSEGRAARDTKSISVVGGKTATIQCPVPVSSGADVRWDKDGSRLPVNHRQRVQTDGTMVVDNVQPKVDEGHYTCSLTDAKGRKKSYTVVVHVIASPTISLSEFQADITVAMRMRALCSVLHGDPPFHFTWLKDGTPVSPDQGLNIQYYQDWSMLSSEHVQLKHAGNYTCIVRNDAAATSQSSILRVNAPPSWTIEPQNAEVVRDRFVRFDCGAKGSPPPSVSWKRATGAEPGDFSPVYNSHKHTLFLNGSLLVQTVDRADAGYYLCQASNGFGAGLSKLIYLTVHEPPRFDIKFKAHAVKKGDTADLGCQAMGDQPLSISWLKDGVVLKNDSRFRVGTTSNEVNRSVHSTLIVSRTDSGDSGIFLCRAANDYGEDEVRVQLLVQEVPGPPPNVTAVNATGRSVSVAWLEPFRGNSAVSRYLVQYAESASADSSTEISNVTVHSPQVMALLSGLKPATSYKLRVLAENSVGWGQPTDWTLMTTEEEAPGDIPRNVTARATGPNSIKVAWVPPKKEVWNGEIKGYHVGYRPTGSEDGFLYKTVEADSPDTEVHLTNLRRSTTYLVTVQAFNSKGAGPKTDETMVKTLDDVPPSAPVLETASVTSSSITISWSQKAAFGNPVREYLLHHRNDSGAWTQTPISTQLPLYTVKQLTCGTSYQFYMTAYNSVGKSEPSDVLYARTDGAAPLSPAREEFITVGAAEATLKLTRWKDGGCNITHFVIKLRPKFRRPWREVSNYLPSNNSHFVLSQLSPATWYEVQIIAHSSAGATEAHYEFKTWNITEEVAVRVTPESPRPKTSPLVTDLEILVPVAVSGLVVLVVIIVGCVLGFKEVRCSPRNDGPLQAASSKQLGEMAMKELASPPLDCLSSEDGTQRSSSQSTSHYPSGQSVYGPARPDGALVTRCERRVVEYSAVLRGDGWLAGNAVSVFSPSRLPKKSSRERPYESLIPADGLLVASPYGMDRAGDG